MTLSLALICVVFWWSCHALSSISTVTTYSRSSSIRHFSQAPLRCGASDTNTTFTIKRTSTASALPNSGTRRKVAFSIAKGERRAHEREVGRRECCERCRRPPVQCVCESLPKHKILTATDILILQHPVEFRRKTFSTVPLISLVLENVQVFVGHNFDLKTPPIREAMDNGSRLLLLFPGPDAIVLDSKDGIRQIASTLTEMEYASRKKSMEGKPSRNLLILMDGTWTQAAKMARNSPELLQHCQTLQFASEDVTSIYDAVRKEPESHCLSTLEAVAKTLQLVEPDTNNAALASHHLHAALQSLVDIQLRYTSSLADPRFVDRKMKGLNRNRRREELEHEIFGQLGRLGDNHHAPMKTISSESSTGNVQGIFNSIVDPSPNVTLDDGTVLQSLKPNDASFINSRWPHRSKKSLAMIQRRLRNSTNACCLGIYGGDDEDQRINLRAFIMQYENGALGMLHVEEAFRRRGYASALLLEASNYLQSENKPCFAYILDGNIPSENLFTKEGWNREDPFHKSGTGKRRAKRKWIKSYS